MRFERAELIGTGTERNFYRYEVLSKADSVTDTGGTKATSGRHTPRFRLLQITDIQLADLSSPNRFEFVNKLAEIEEAKPFIPGHRPSELLTLHAAIASIEKANSIHDRRRVDVALFTGDLIDSSQLNEAEAIVSILEGGEVDPGVLFGSYQGVQGPFIDDYFYYKPEAPSDLMGDRFGFPRIKGLLEASLASQRSPGLTMPWLVANGNHEVLIQGMGAVNHEASSHATRDRKPIGFKPTDINYALLAKGYEADPTSLFPIVDSVVIEPLGSRRALLEGELGAMIRNAKGEPKGHGLTDYISGEFNYLSYFGDGDFVVIALDSANRAGGARGRVSKSAYVILEENLTKAHRDFPTALIVVISHHSLSEIDFEEGEITLGQIESILNRYKVLLWLSGHTHKDRVVDNITNPNRSFIEVTSASIADWPSSIREIEVFDDAVNGKLVINLRSHVVSEGATTGDMRAIESGELSELVAVHAAIATNSASLLNVDVEAEVLKPLSIEVPRERYL
ncbi:MAG: metallophosphoesterase [Actinomycetota bacterium]|nr:metallophosphoesterase [Actinomycetota bacterium]